MASSEGYLDFILEQLSDTEDVSWRAMHHLLPRKGCRRYL